ncbi:MAG: hypothetical protein ACP5T3_01120 [Candidatus Micrarchaeia archaeon]
MSYALSLLYEFLPVLVGIALLKALMSLRISGKKVTILFNAEAALGSANKAAQNRRAATRHAAFCSLANDLLIMNGSFAGNAASAERMSFDVLGLVDLSDPGHANVLLSRQKHKSIRIAASREELLRCIFSSGKYVLAYVLGYDIGVANA